MQPRRRRPWLVATTFTIALAVGLTAGLFLAELAPRRGIASAAAVVAPPGERGCEQYAVAAFNMGDKVDRAFATHAKAHHDFMAGKIVYGTPKQPGTVLYIWRTTLHERERHSPHYRELRQAFDACIEAG